MVYGRTSNEEQLYCLVPAPLFVPCAVYGCIVLCFSKSMKYGFSPTDSVDSLDSALQTFATGSPAVITLKGQVLADPLSPDM